MRRGSLYGLAAAAMVLLVSCAFVLQGFLVLDGTLNPGEKTKARFIVRPFSTDRDRVYQFVVVGVDEVGDLTVGGAKWGTNGTFGGPRTMPVSGPLAAAMAASDTCVRNGLAFQSITGMKWKAFMIEVGTRGKINLTADIDVIVKATSGAAKGLETVMGVTGSWLDDGDSVVDADDTFFCTGISTSNISVI